MSNDVLDWSRMAEEYDKVAPFTSMFAADCIKYLNLPQEFSKDILVLDIAAGTGSFSLSLANMCNASSNGRIIATDASPGMISVIKRKCLSILSPEQQSIITCRVMDGQNLDIPENSVQFIACIFGIMFFPDRLKGLREMYRVLKSDGVACVIVWKENMIAQMFENIAILENKITTDQTPLPSTKMIHCYADTGILKQDLESAGFKADRIEILEVSHSFDFEIQSLQSFMCSNPTAISMSLTPADISKQLNGLASPDNSQRVTIHGTANLVRATK